MKKKIAIIGGQGFIAKNLASSLKTDFSVTVLNSNDVLGYLVPATNHFEIIIYACEPALTSIYDHDLKIKLDLKRKKIFENLPGFYLYLSTTKVYENSNQAHLHEGLDIKATSSYCAFKFKQEQNFLNQNMLVFRLSNIIGPSLHSSTLMSKLMLDFSSKERIIEVNEVHSYVNYLDVKDLAGAIRAVIANRKFNRSNLFNIASKNTYSISQIIDFVGDAFNSKDFLIKPKNYNKNTVSNKLQVIDISKARELLGWYPRINLNKSINKIKEQLTL